MAVKVPTMSLYYRRTRSADDRPLPRIENSHADTNVADNTKQVEVLNQDAHLDET
jgi:hypothetical protein